jgi:hypothetical protein
VTDDHTQPGADDTDPPADVIHLPVRGPNAHPAGNGHITDTKIAGSAFVGSVTWGQPDSLADTPQDAVEIARLATNMAVLFDNDPDRHAAVMAEALRRAEWFGGCGPGKVARPAYLDGLRSVWADVVARRIFPTAIQ